MPFVPVANTVEFEMRAIQDSQKVENTLYFGRNFAPTAAQMLAFGTLLAGWWVTFMAPHITTALELKEVYATDLSSATGPTASYVPPTPITGADAAAPLPMNVSLCISLRTANRGRSFRGRNFIAGLTRDAVVANTMVPSYDTAFLAAYNQLLSLGTATGWAWYVVSRFSGVNPTTHAPIPRATGVRTAISNVVIVDSTVDGMRRRLPGRGR